MKSQITFGDLFSAEDVRAITKLLNNVPEGSTEAKHLHDNFMLNHMPHINKVTGQENDAMYFSYYAIHVLDTFYTTKGVRR